MTSSSPLANLSPAGIAKLPLPADLAEHVRHLDSGALGTPGTPAGGDWAELIESWTRSLTSRFVWMGAVGHGVQSRALRLCVGLPDVGLFMQRRVCGLEDEDGTVFDGRIEGAFEMTARVLAQANALSAAGRWPSGRRLLLVDDDFGDRTWGWIEPGTPAPEFMHSHPSMYLLVLTELRAMHSSARQNAPA